MKSAISNSSGVHSTRPAFNITPPIEFPVRSPSVPSVPSVVELLDRLTAVEKAIAKLNLRLRSITQTVPKFSAVPKTTSEKVHNIINAVAIATGYAPHALISPCRSGDLSKVRWIAIAIIHQYTTLTLVAIGDTFQRDHGTIMHALKGIKTLIAVDKEFAQRFREISNDIIGRYQLGKPLRPLMPCANMAAAA